MVVFRISADPGKKDAAGRFPSMLRNRKTFFVGGNSMQIFTETELEVYRLMSRGFQNR